MPDQSKDLKKKFAEIERECNRLSEANQQLNERVLELYTLYSVSKTLSLSLQLDELFDVSMRIIGETLKVTDYNLMLLDDATGSLYIQAVHGNVEEKVRKAILAPGEGQPGKVFKKALTIHIKDLSKSKGWVYAKDEKSRKGSYIGIPLKRPNGSAIGVLNVHKHEPKGFADEEIRMFEAVAEHVAIALENARSFQRTRELSHRDDLTGLYNRRYFFDRYEKESERAKRYNRFFSLLLIDLDHFKIFNDTHGHLSGDRALKTVAEALTKTVRKVDIVARYGGEEFVVILPETDKESASIVGEKIRKNVEKLKLGMDGGGQWPLTMTIGVSSFPIDSTDALDLLEKADKALYHGKARGRNQVCSKALDD